MAKRRSDSGKHDPESESNSLPTADVPLGESAERDVPTSTDPPKPARDRKIHKRRKVPQVPKGESVDDPAPTPPANIDSE